MANQFLSTPSARRATWSPCRNRRRDSYFYPRPPRGGRLLKDGDRQKRKKISIHALREEGDLSAESGLLQAAISIHALREEGDSTFCSPHPHGHYFYPRPPRGGRPGCPVIRRYNMVISIHALREEGDRSVWAALKHQIIFLSTPSARRATSRCSFPKKVYCISIHALREEGDADSDVRRKDKLDFYPRPPRGGRRHRTIISPAASIISIHALREEGDLMTSRSDSYNRRFLSTPSARRATAAV